jgi:hypothetical protein
MQQIKGDLTLIRIAFSSPYAGPHDSTQQMRGLQSQVLDYISFDFA